MPAQRPRASFEPIAPDVDVSALVEQTPNFQFVSRISCDMIDQQGIEAFDRLVLLHVVVGGKPLVIDGWQTRLDPWTFSSKWLQDNHGEKVENARNLSKKEPLPLTISHYLKNMSKLTDQYFDRPENYRDKDRQRVYLKDIDCPEVWQNKLKEALPSNLFYLNESTGDLGGPGAVDEPIPTGGKRRGRGIAGAGDLMSSLPPPMRAENLMCYIGHEGTYTPAHREMCASLGHNIMVETSGLVSEDGKPERPGSSIWFMTETNDRHSVSEYWLSQLGHDIEVETHFAQLAAWKRAPFTTYVVEQRAGDFILIPPMAPHQVWNRGTRTMKVAWNRTTVETLELAMKEALPNARLVCRDEQYKNKAIIYYSLLKYSGLLGKARDQEQTAPSPQEAALLRTSSRIKHLQKDFKRLFNLFKGILLSETFSPDNPHEKNVQFNPYDSNITCAYCRGNIFNRFLTCTNCDDALNTPEPEPYDICMECYAMGRSCGCISKLKWAEQFKWKDLVQKYEHWRRLYIEIERGLKPTSPLPIQEERERLVSKTLAQVCQEQLKRRPFVDPNKPQAVEEEESDENEEIEINNDGTVKKKRKRRSEAWLKNHHACHVCCHRHEKWKMAECKCGRWWCYGTLFRAHDLMPQEVMEDPNWQCPHCKLICSAGNCKKDPRQDPYQPKGTLLGHDTRKVADVRSVESLVDFAVSNLNWLNETSKEAPINNARLTKRQEEAERAKAHDPTFEDHYGSEEEAMDHAQENGISYSPDRSAIDPRLSNNALIDPSLQDDRTTLATPLRSSASTLPTVAALLNGVGPSTSNTPLSHEHIGYVPAMHSGYVAPSAVLYSRHGEEDAEGDSVYPDVEDDDQEQTYVSRKRKADNDEIKRVPAKKRQRPDDIAQPISGATKQYRKEQERKSLEEARKQGRFIQVHAAIKGKSKIVKLKVGRHALSQLKPHRITRGRLSIGGGDGAQDEAEDNDLLRSDIAPPRPKAQPRASGSEGLKSAKQVRIRVEHDDDFNTSRKHRGHKLNDAKSAKASNKKVLSAYEEVEILTESDAEDLENSIQVDGAVETTVSGAKKRRISSWQARRLGDDGEDLPDALPADWRDAKAGLRHVRREDPTDLPRHRQTRKPAGKSMPQIRPSSRQQDAGDSSSAEEGENDLDESQQSTRQMSSVAAAALQQEEENRKAKLAAAGLMGDSDKEEEESIFVSEAVPTIKVSSGSKQIVNALKAPGSIMARRRPGDRMIKIVSKTGRRRTTGGIGGEGNFSSANRIMAKSSPMTRT